jgi:hypothetical protein
MLDRAAPRDDVNDVHDFPVGFHIRTVASAPALASRVRPLTSTGRGITGAVIG